MTDAPERVLDHRRTMLVFAGMMVSTFLASLDTTAVSTALPTMAGDLGGIDQLPWVLTSYLLGSVAATPLYGKLSDLYGRRALTEVALVVFIVASLLCGAAQTMLQLVLARGLQGIGGGGLMAMGFIVIGDIFSPRERGKYMAYYTMNFSVSSIVGPVLGGFFVETLSWRWVFFVNLPIGLVALWVIHRQLTFTLPPREHRLDLVGAALLVASVIALIVGLSIAGDAVAWSSPLVIGLLAGAVIGAVAFVAWERRAPEPILPMRLFRNPTFRILIGGNTAYGLAAMSVMAYLPLFFQVALGESPTAAGLILGSTTIAVTGGSYLAGRITTGTGRYLRLLRVAPLLTVAALGLLTLLGVGDEAWWAIPALLVMGLSMGMAFPTMTTAVQNSLALPDLGAGTAAINFFRTLGQTLGVGIFGALLAGTITRQVADVDASIDSAELLATPEEIQSLEPALRAVVEGAVADGTAAILWLAIPLMALQAAAMWLLPELELRTTTALDAQKADA